MTFHLHLTDKGRKRLKEGLVIVMVQQGTNEAGWAMPAMEKSEKEPPHDCQRASGVLEMTPRDANDCVQTLVTRTCTASSNVEHQPFSVAKSHQQSLNSCPEWDGNWLETLSEETSSLTVQSSTVGLRQTPMLLSSASSTHRGGGTGVPLQRILPETKYTPNYSAAAALSSMDDFHNILQLDLRDWSPVIPTELTKLETETLAPGVSEDNSISVQSLTTVEAAQSMTTMVDIHGSDIMASGSFSFCSDVLAAQQFALLDPIATGSHTHSCPQSHISTHPFNLLQPSASPCSSNPTAGSCLGFPPNDLSGLQFSASSRTESELSSLPSDAGVAAGRRERITVGGESASRQTHPGCSTLRYNRKHNPGLHRPRTYKCNVQGQLITIDCLHCSLHYYDE